MNQNIPLTAQEQKLLASVEQTKATAAAQAPPQQVTGAMQPGGGTPVPTPGSQQPNMQAVNAAQPYVKGVDQDGDDTYTFKKAMLDKLLIDTSKYAVMATQMQGTNQGNYGHGTLPQSELDQLKKANDPNIAIDQLRNLQK